MQTRRSFRLGTLAHFMLEDRTTPAIVGGLDSTFNGGGLSEIRFDSGGSNADTASSVARQLDGKIVVIGTAQSGPVDTDFAIARLNATGELDTTFGNNGIAVLGFDLAGGNVDSGRAIVVDSLGRIVVGGTVQASASGETDFGIARLTPTGELDTTFGMGGRTTVAFDSGGAMNDRLGGLAIDSVGRIVVAGTADQFATGDTDFAIARLLSNGQLDTSFGTNGLQQVNFDLGGSKADTLADVVIDANNRPVLVGTSVVNLVGDTDFSVARLTLAGNLDTTFGTNGLVSIGFDLGGTFADQAAGVVIDSQNNIVIVGTVEVDGTGDTDPALVRLTPAGALDTTFNSSGKLSFGFDVGGNNADSAGGVAIDRFTNNIVVSATIATAMVGDTDVGVARFLPNGQLDTSFATSGRAVVNFDRGGNNADRAAGVLTDPQGRVVVVGTAATATAGDTDVVAARLIGRIDSPSRLLVSGTADRTAVAFDVGQNGFEQLGVRNPGFDQSGSLVRSVSADFNGDGFADEAIAVGPGGGSRIVVSFGIDPLLAPTSTVPAPLVFDAYEPGFQGGLFLAAADLDGDGQAELATSPDVGGGGRVQIFSLDPTTASLRDNFFGIADPSFRGGARVAFGDLNGDNRPELIVGAGFGGGPRVAIFDGSQLGFGTAEPRKLIGDFFAFPGSDAVNLRNGVFVAAGDVDGDGLADLAFGGGPGGAPRVFILDGAFIANNQIDTAQNSPLANFFVNNNVTSRGGIRLAFKDLDGDNRADLITGTGEQEPSRVRVYQGANFPAANGSEPTLSQQFDPFGFAPLGGVFVG